MLVRYMSDLHLEFGPLKDGPNSADVLILAGDISVSTNIDWINQQSDRFEHVIYINGNHEFYGGHLTNTIEETAEKLNDNVHYLNNESIVIDGVSFHGTTLWTDINKGDPNIMYRVNGMLNDFNYIFFDDETGLKKFNFNKWIDLNNEATDFLQSVVKEGDVVVSHHAPSLLSAHPRYKNDPLNFLYMSDMSKFMDETKPAYWIHGHTHASFDYGIYDTRVLCNPRGYFDYQENGSFDINASFTV